MAYWNSVHGDKPEEVLADKEGMQTLRRQDQFLQGMTKGRAQALPFLFLLPTSTSQRFKPLNTALRAICTAAKGHHKYGKNTGNPAHRAPKRGFSSESGLFGA